MSNGFDASDPPFDRLNQAELGEVRAAADIAYYRPGETILSHGQRAESLHVVIKGSVEAREAGNLNAVLGPKDSFDSRALVHGMAGEDFIAAEETLCHLLPRALILDLIARLKAEGRVSIIMVLHNYVHVLTACDRVNLIQDGRITLDKPTSETSVEELTEIVVDEYRRARQAANGQTVRR
jgi:CRP-like cAMP-binding protein